MDIRATCQISIYSFPCSDLLVYSLSSPLKGVLDDCKMDLHSSQDVYEAIGEFLTSGTENEVSENEIMDVCEQLFKKMCWWVTAS